MHDRWQEKGPWSQIRQIRKKLHLLFQHCTGFCFLTRTLSKKDVSSILQFFFPVMRCECTEIVQDFFKLIEKPARRSSASQLRLFSFYKKLQSHNLSFHEEKPGFVKFQKTKTKKCKSKERKRKLSLVTYIRIKQQWMPTKVKT